MIKITYDGKTLNDEITGFKVRSVSGRELLSGVVTERDYPVIDGAELIRRRHESRDIIVTFSLQAPTKEAHAIRFNNLNALLNKSEAKLIFSDEDDKYFIASTAEMDSNTITFHCSDPYKYATTVKTFPATLKDGILTTDITNNGNVSVPIKYTVTHNHDNGYIGIVSENSALQFGTIEEADGEIKKQNECLCNIDDFKTDVGSTAIDSMHTWHDVTGTLKNATWFNKNWLTFGTFGTKTDVRISGGQRKVVLKADAAGEVGAKNWYTYLYSIMWAGRVGQVGEFCINFETADGKQIAGLNWFKNDESGNTGAYELWGNGKLLRTYTYTTDGNPRHNPYMSDNGHCDIRKEGNKLTFYYWGQYPSFVIPEIENMICKQITISMKAYRNAKNGTLTHMGLHVFDFYKLNVEAWHDSPNRFPAGTTMVIDGETCKSYLNGMCRPTDEMMGSTYFKASPGTTKVDYYFSSFSDPAPSVTAEIREAWL